MIEILTYKNKPILKLIEDNQEQNYKSSIQFGLRKARLILANIDSIKKFIENNSGEK